MAKYKRFEGEKCMHKGIGKRERERKKEEQIERESDSDKRERESFMQFVVVRSMFQLCACAPLQVT